MADNYQAQNSYRQIEAILEGRRLAAAHGLEGRRMQAYGKAPELEGVEYEIAEAGLKYNKALLAGAYSLPETQTLLEAEISSLREKRGRILAQHGIPEESLMPTPVCPRCNDSGYAAVTGGYRERCSCFKQLLFNSIESASNIHAAGAGDFALFDETLFSNEADEAKYRQQASPRENILKIKDSAQKFVQALAGGSDENLYFFGQPGSGKTFMAAAIAHELMGCGIAVLYLSAPALFNAITEYRMRSMRDGSYSDALYRQITGVKLLIIDDLGTEPPTDARFSEFVSLLNERVAPCAQNAPGGRKSPGEQNAHGGRNAPGAQNAPEARNAPGARSTIISTNKSIKEIQTLYDERVLSRIVGSFRIIKFYGDDIRMQRLRRPGV